ncbi:MAG: YihY/virulence factor BrkB family protein [Saprospiraceae bacterium]
MNRLEQIWTYLTEHPLWVQLLSWAKTHSLPGLKRLPLYDVIGFIRRELRNDALVTRANSIAFSFFLSLFPAIIVLFTLLAYTPLYANFGEVLEESIREIMPGEAGKLLFESVENIATKQRSGLLSFGFVLALWFSSNGMLTLMQGLEKNYRVSFRRRSAWEKRLIALQLTFIVVFLLVVSVVLVILGNTLLGLLFRYIDVDGFTRIALQAFRWLVVLLLFYAGFSFVYRYGASTHRRIPFFTPGATLATILSILVSLGFSFYVDNFGSYNKLYGSIGALIALMLWLQLNCMILLIGFELNASILVLRDIRRRKSDKSAAAKT